MNALILGGAAGVHDEAARAMGLFEPDVVLAVNNIGIDWPGWIDHWVTLHPLKTGNWPGMLEALRQRLADGRNKPLTWSHRHMPGIDCISHPDWGGSSGLLAVKVALVDLKCRRAVLAGMPLENGPHYFGTPWRS